MTDDGPAVAYPSQCWHCGCCRIACPTGSIAYRKGWLDEATQHFQMACNMDPANGEYRQALMMMRQGGQAYRPYGYGGGIDACDCCTACLCMNMCCGN